MIKKPGGAITSVILVICLIIAAIFAFRRIINKPAPPEITEIQKPTSTAEIKTEKVEAVKSAEPVEAVKPAESIKQEVPKIAKMVQDKKTLKEIVMAARSWQPAFTSWQGKTVPDFELADLNGTSHRLSNYRGKNVLLIFWATWCGPCKREIPELIEIRKEKSENELAILAISRERPDTVKRFASSNKINYTVLIEDSPLSEPYSLVRGIPSAMFIDPDGKMKIGTTGLVSLAEIEAILGAEQ